MKNNESTAGVPSVGRDTDETGNVDPRSWSEYEPDSTSVKHEAKGEEENRSDTQCSSDTSLPQAEQRPAMKPEANQVHSTHEDVPCDLWMPGLDLEDPLREERLSSYVEPLDVEGNDPLHYPVKRETIDSGYDKCSGPVESDQVKSHTDGAHAAINDERLIHGIDLLSTVLKSMLANSGTIGSSPETTSKENSTNVDLQVHDGVGHPLAMDKTNGEPTGVKCRSSKNETEFNVASPSILTGALTGDLPVTASHPVHSYENLDNNITSPPDHDLTNLTTESVPCQAPLISALQQHPEYERSNAKPMTPLLKVRSDLHDPEHAAFRLSHSTYPNTSIANLPCLNFKKYKSKSCQVDIFKPETEFVNNMFAHSNESGKPPLLANDDSAMNYYSKSLIYNVVEYFKNKKKKFRLNYNLKNVVCEITRSSRSTIDSVMRSAHRSLKDNPTLLYPRFQGDPTESCSHCGEVLVDFAIRQIIHNGYIQEGKALTVKEIYNRLMNEELTVCKNFLKKRIRDLGFDLLRSVSTSRYIPLERPEMAARRYQYFIEIQKCRITRRQIVYVFEADIFKVPDTKGVWRLMEGHSMNNSDTRMMTVICAAKECGFIDGSLLCHGATFREHRRTTQSLTQYWLNYFLPKLPLGSVVVLGHSRHHLVRAAKPKPDVSWSKPDIVKWLKDHNEHSFTSTMLTAVLLEKVQSIDVGSKFGIDELIISHGHIPLHMPPNHRELNPTELIWSTIAAKFPSNTLPTEESMRNFLMNEFDRITPIRMQESFESARIHESTLRQMDMRIDEPVAEVVRQVGGILDRDHALEVDEISDEETSADIRLETPLEPSILKSRPMRDLAPREEVFLLNPPSKKRKSSVTEASGRRKSQDAPTRPKSANHSQVSSTQETTGCSRDGNEEDCPEWTISSSCSLTGPTDSAIHQPYGSDQSKKSDDLPLENLLVPESGHQNCQSTNPCEIMSNGPFNDCGEQCFMPQYHSPMASPTQLAGAITESVAPIPDNHPHQDTNSPTNPNVEVIDLVDSDEDTLSDPGPIDLTEDDVYVDVSASDNSPFHCPTETSDTLGQPSTVHSNDGTTVYLRDLIKSKFEQLKTKM